MTKLQEKLLNQYINNQMNSMNQMSIKNQNQKKTLINQKLTFSKMNLYLINNLFVISKNFLYMMNVKKNYMVKFLKQSLIFNIKKFHKFINYLGIFIFELIIFRILIFS